MRRPPDFLPMGSVTGIGSLPLTDPQAAIRLVAQVCPEVPFWPQLPRLSAREHMIEQALGPQRALFVPRKTGYGYRIKPGLLRVCLHELHNGIATATIAFAYLERGMGVISNAKERVIIQVEMCTKRFGLKAYLSRSITREEWLDTPRIFVLTKLGESRYIDIQRPDMN